MAKKRRRKRILKIIKDAKQCFIEGKSAFMCHCFAEAHPKLWWGKGSLEMRIRELIPEFNQETLGSNTPKDCNVWWSGNKQDEYRIKAFDKLIEIYDDTRSS